MKKNRKRKTKTKKKKKSLKKIDFKKKIKSENENILRSSKNNEQKVEIVKIKKQATEKKIFKIKDYVVYPKHGVGKILSFNNKI